MVKKIKKTWSLNFLSILDLGFLFIAPLNPCGCVDTAIVRRQTLELKLNGIFEFQLIDIRYFQEAYRPKPAKKRKRDREQKGKYASKRQREKKWKKSNMEPMGYDCSSDRTADGKMTEPSSSGFEFGLEESKAVNSFSRAMNIAPSRPVSEKATVPNPAVCFDNTRSSAEHSFNHRSTFLDIPYYKDHVRRFNPASTPTSQFQNPPSYQSTQSYQEVQNYQNSQSCQDNYY